MSDDDEAGDAAAMAAFEKRVQEIVAKAVAAEREACANVALLIETEGHADLYGDPDMSTPITNAIRARNNNSN